MKKENYLKWDEYFMGIALLSAERSKDPNTSVGACIVSQDNKILSVGYNGMPRGCSDNEYPWSREASSDLDTKYLYVCHAELNAILNYTGTNMERAKIYTTLFPCNECTKALIQVGKRQIFRPILCHRSKADDEICRDHLYQIPECRQINPVDVIVFAGPITPRHVKLLSHLTENTEQFPILEC